ncbi:MAG: EAL domain-containing protein, partial [Alkalispirochaeta sp.]
SLDNFGSGDSSLGYLQRLPIEKLKLDRSLISGIEESRSRQTVVQAAIHLARARRWRVVGEGIERPEEGDTLRAPGCDIDQGYLCARPLASEDVSACIGTFYVKNQMHEGEVL